MNDAHESVTVHFNTAWFAIQENYSEALLVHFPNIQYN